MTMMRLGLAALPVAAVATLLGFSRIAGPGWDGAKILAVVALTFAIMTVTPAAIEAGWFGRLWQERRESSARRRRQAARIASQVGIAPAEPTFGG